MSDDLKEQLKANALDECDEAADRITALEAQLAAATRDRDAAVAQALEMAAKAAFRACKATGTGYRDENERLLQRAENEMRLETQKAIRALTPADATAAPEAVKREAGAVKVKPLVWNEYLASNGKRIMAYADTPLTTYRVNQRFFPEEAFTVESVDMERSIFNTFEAARDAAQADYEARILAAIEREG